MPSPRELFETEVPGTFALDNVLTFPGADVPAGAGVPLRHYIDFESRSRHLALFIPDYVPIAKFLYSIPSQLDVLLKMAPGNVALSASRKVGSVAQKLKVEHLGETVRMSFSGDGLVEVGVDELPFTGRITVYSATELNEAERALITKAWKVVGLFPWFRGPAFAAAQDAHSRPVAFVSHDSRDKVGIVRPLVSKLQSMLLPLWYDEYSLTVGQSLRDSIEEGLRTCPKCIVILTPNFLSKGGWPKREYTSVFTRELVEDQDVFLPVWAGVERDEVFAYSPILADKVGLQWSAGLDEVAKALYKALTALGVTPYADDA